MMMEKYTRFLFFTTFVILLNSSSCIKDKSKDPITYISQETKDFCIFKSGTWWEYVNTNTNQIDTWKIVNSTITSYINKKHSNTEFEFISLKFTTILHDTFTFNIHNASMGLFFTPKYGGIQSIIYYDEYLIKNDAVCDNNSFKLYKKDSVNNLCIKKKFKMLPFPCNGLFPSKVEWERKIGITNMTYPNGDSLVLKSYYIIQ